MKEKNLAILLHIIRNNGNINRIIREGVTFKEVTELTEFAEKKGYLTYDDEKISITGSGIEFLTNAEGLIKKTNKDEWIEKDFKNKIPKLGKNVLYLPRQNELPF